MAEVTRVPLQPIAKGSVLKLWLGILLVLALAGGLAYWAMPRGVEITVVTAGEGASPADGDVVFVKYTGKLTDGTVFDKSQDLNLPVQGILPDGTPMSTTEGSTIPGFREALLKMQKGGKYEIRIPADQGLWRHPASGFADPGECRPDLRGRTGRLHARGRCKAPLPDAAAADGWPAAG